MMIHANQVIAYARAEEIHQNSSATGFTLLKFRRGAIDGLVTAGRLGPEEYAAAREFSAIFLDITKDVHYTNIQQMWRARVDTRRGPAGSAEPTPAEIARWRRYRDFSNHWSKQRKRKKIPLLAIIVAAAVDEQPIEHIAQDHGLSVKNAERMLIRGLRDYARRAGWIQHAHQDRGQRRDSGPNRGP